MSIFKPRTKQITEFFNKDLTEEWVNKDMIKEFLVQESKVSTGLKDLSIRVERKFDISITLPTISNYLKEKLGEIDYRSRKKLFTENKRRDRVQKELVKKNNICIYDDLDSYGDMTIRSPNKKEQKICGYRGVILNSSLANKMIYKFEIGPINIGIYDLASLPNISRSTKEVICNKEYYDLCGKGLSLGEDIITFQYLKKEKRFVEQKRYNKIKIPIKCHVTYLGEPRKGYRSTYLFDNEKLVKKKIKFWKQKVHMFGYKQINKESFVDDDRGYTYKVRDIIDGLDVDIVGNAIGRIKPSHFNILGQMIDHRTTNIERIIDKWLRLNTIKYIREYRINFIDGQTRVDFFVLPNICIYCDGEYFHSLPGAKKRDLRQNLELPKMGYKVIRLSEKDINQGVRPTEILSLI